MAVLIQISLPLSDAVDGLIEQNQLAVVPLMTSDSMERTSVLGEEDEVVEDWVSDTCSEDVAQSNGRCFLPLSVELLAFSMPLGGLDNFCERQEDVGVESSIGQEHYSKWFQSRFRV